MGKTDDEIDNYDGDIRDLFKQTRDLVENKLGVSCTMDQVVNDVMTGYFVERFHIMDEMEVSMRALSYVRFMCAADLSMSEGDLIELAQVMISCGIESAKKVRGILINTAYLVRDIFDGRNVGNIPDYGDKLATLVTTMGFIGQVDTKSGNAEVTVVTLINNLNDIVDQVVAHSGTIRNSDSIDAAKRVIGLIHSDALAYLTKIATYQTTYMPTLPESVVKYKEVYEEVVEIVDSDRNGKLIGSDKLRVEVMALMAMLIGMGKREDFITFMIRITSSVSMMGDMIFKIATEGSGIDWRDDSVGTREILGALSKFTEKINEDVDDETAKGIDLERIVNDLRASKHGKSK